MRWIVAALLAVSSTNLSAQTSDSKGYVFGGVSFPWEQGVTTGGDYRTYLAAPGGWSTGLFLGGGGHVGRFVSLEVEWHRTGVMEATEPSRYFITYSAERRDTSVGVGARFHVALSQRVALEPVGLLEFVHEQSWLAQTVETPGLPPRGSLTDYTPFVDSWGRGIAGGVDLRAGGRGIAVLPGVRFHRFSRGADAGGTWPGGLSNWGVEITVALRADF